jgi:hypothetical protein
MRLPAVRDAGATMNAFAWIDIGFILGYFAAALMWMAREPE